MAEKVALYAKLDELEKEVAQGHKIKGRIAELEDEKRLNDQEVAKWKELAHEWKAKEDELHAEMAAEKQTKAKYLRQLTEAQTELKQANVLIEKQKVDMKIDARAREGQVKRSKIMEHELKEIQAENAHQAELRAQAEARTRELEKFLNQERALRLQDIHKNFRMGGAQKLAESREREAAALHYAAEATIRTQSARIEGIEAALRAHEVIEAAGLPIKDTLTHSSDPYAVLVFEAWAAKTAIVHDSTSPRWSVRAAPHKFRARATLATAPTTSTRGRCRTCASCRPRWSPAARPSRRPRPCACCGGGRKNRFKHGRGSEAGPFRRLGGPAPVGPDLRGRRRHHGSTPSLS